MGGTLFDVDVERLGQIRTISGAFQVGRMEAVDKKYKHQGTMIMRGTNYGLTTMGLLTSVY